MKIRLAENFRAIFYAPFYATQALGFYEREGVDIDFVDSSVPGNAVAGLLDGTIDLTWGGPMRVMQAHDREPESPLVCFCEVVSRDPFYLVGRSGGAPFRLADLRGRRLATVAEVPTPWMCLQHDLRLVGIDPEALKRVSDRPMATSVAALCDGRLEVAQLFEPYVSLALRAGAGEVLYAASARGPTVYTSFIASRDRIAREPEAFAAMTRAVAVHAGMARQPWPQRAGGDHRRLLPGCPARHPGGCAAPLRRGRHLGRKPRDVAGGIWAVGREPGVGWFSAADAEL